MYRTIINTIAAEIRRHLATSDQHSEGIKVIAEETFSSKNRKQYLMETADERS